jgi:hypothetical protein
MMSYSLHMSLVEKKYILDVGKMHIEINWIGMDQKGEHN